MCSNLPRPLYLLAYKVMRLFRLANVATICMGTCSCAHANCVRVTREKYWLNTGRLSRLDNDNSLP